MSSPALQGTDTLRCPKCDGTGGVAYRGRSGEATRLECTVCEGTGSLAGLIERAHDWVPDDLRARVLVRRLRDALDAFTAHRPAERDEDE